ncbi:MAG TPA: PQQ-binding-like beta-propeller repeat protein [Thermoguttaceae bacterium]|nr:PQQ-binding-like beta-propeller repeat protein [Thermoguttaceae bacterium]
MKCLAASLGSILVLCVLGASRSAVSADWPRFNGPNQDNISTDKGLLREWPKDGPRLVWKATDIGEGYAGVTVGGGRIYTSGNVGDKTTVTALDLGGKQQWQSENGRAYKASFPGARGTPTLDGDRVYDESPLGQVTCFDAKSGKPIWTLNLLEKFGGKVLTWGLAESVLIDGDHVICCPGGKTAMVALDKRTGETVWQSKSAEGDLAGYASPALIEYKGLRLVLTMTDGALIGVNAKTGELLFRFSHPTKYKVNALMPLFHEGCVFISSGYGTTGSVLVKLNVRGRKAEAVQVWQAKELDNHHGGVVLLDGYVYGAAHDGGKNKWVCLDWKTGKVLWAEKGIGKGSLTAADGLLYTMNESRAVGLVKPSPEKYDLVSRFTLPRGGKGNSWAHPVVCGGRLYLRHGNFLHAYDVAK